MRRLLAISFHSVQTGKHIQTSYFALSLELVFWFPFRSNGKAQSDPAGGGVAGVAGVAGVSIPFKRESLSGVVISYRLSVFS